MCSLSDFIRLSREKLRLAYLLAATFLVLVVLVLMEIFNSNDAWLGAAYVILGLTVTMWVAFIAHESQKDLSAFLFGKVDTRQKRTEEIIRLCEQSNDHFFAVTSLPAVGIRDSGAEKDSDDFLKALGRALDRGVEVTLISAERDACEEMCKNFDGVDPDDESRCMRALNNVCTRYREYNELASNGSRIKFRWHQIPRAGLTLHLCCNDSTALMYDLSLKDDRGDRGWAFISSDSRILHIVEGTFDRYKALAETLDQPVNCEDLDRPQPPHEA